MEQTEERFWAELENKLEQPEPMLKEYHFGTIKWDDVQHLSPASLTFAPGLHEVLSYMVLCTKPDAPLGQVLALPLLNALFLIAIST